MLPHNFPTLAHIARLNRLFGSDRRASLGIGTSAALAAAFLCLGNTLLHAQFQPSRPVVVPSSPAREAARESLRPKDPTELPALTPAKLSDELVTIDTIGLSMRVPEWSPVSQSTQPDRPLDIEVNAADQTWQMLVQVRQTANAENTVEQTVTSILDNVAKQSAGTNLRDRTTVSQAIVLQRIDDFRVDGCPTPGTRLYVKMPDAAGNPVIKGFTVFKPLPTTFVIFELTAAEKHFALARSNYEVSVATVAFSDPSVLMQQRAAMLVAGQEFFSNLTASNYEAIADGTERWYRLYQPGASGNDRDAQELGYRAVRMWKGRQSELATSGGSNVEGILVEIKGRILDTTPGQNNRPIDSVTRAFMSFDRASETWTTTTTVLPANSRGTTRQGSSKPLVFREIGSRSGRSMNVVLSQPGVPDKSITPIVQGDQLISQVESYMLPQLLARSGRAEADLGYYVYRPELSTVSLRRDRLSRDAKYAGAITVRTTGKDDKPMGTTILREDGVIVRTELPHTSIGQGAIAPIWEPTEGEALLRLWRNKGLPTGDR